MSLEARTCVSVVVAALVFREKEDGKGGWEWDVCRKGRGRRREEEGEAQRVWMVRWRGREGRTVGVL